MANHISALKRARQTEKKTATNRANKSHMRSALRSLRTALTTGDKTALDTTFRETVSVLDRACRRVFCTEDGIALQEPPLGSREGRNRKPQPSKPFDRMTAASGLPFFRLHGNS